MQLFIYFFFEGMKLFVLTICLIHKISFPKHNNSNLRSVRSNIFHIEWLSHHWFILFWDKHLFKIFDVTLLLQIWTAHKVCPDFSFFLQWSIQSLIFCGCFFAVWNHSQGKCKFSCIILYINVGFHTHRGIWAVFTHPAFFSLNLEVTLSCRSQAHSFSLALTKLPNQPTNQSAPI